MPQTSPKSRSLRHGFAVIEDHQVNVGFLFGFHKHPKEKAAVNYSRLQKKCPKFYRSFTEVLPKF